MHGWCIDGAYVSETDILNHLRVEVALAHDLLEHLEDDAIEGCVFEAAFLALGEGCADGERDDYIVGILLCAREA